MDIMFVKWQDYFSGVLYCGCVVTDNRYYELSVPEVTLT